MDELGTWCVIWVVATVLNAVPAFMPPTWSLLAYFHLRYQLLHLALGARRRVGGGRWTGAAGAR